MCITRLISCWLLFEQLFCRDKSSKYFHITKSNIDRVIDQHRQTKTGFLRKTGNKKSGAGRLCSQEGVRKENLMWHETEQGFRRKVGAVLHWQAWTLALYMGYGLCVAKTGKSSNWLSRFFLPANYQFRAKHAKPNATQRQPNKGVQFFFETLYVKLFRNTVNNCIDVYPCANCSKNNHTSFG